MSDRQNRSGHWEAVRIGGAGEIANARVQVATVRAQREVWRDPARQFYFGPVELRGRPIHGPNYTSIHALKLDVLEIVVEGRRVEYQLSVEQFRFQTALIRVRSEEHTSELQSLMRISYAAFCL